MSKGLAFGITGATGFIGSHVASRALADGHRVRAFGRRPWTEAPFVPLADRRFLNLPLPPSPDDLRGLDALIHLAVAPQGADPEQVYAVNVLGTHLLYEAAIEAGVGRFLFVSSQSAHEGATSPYGRSKLLTETELEGDDRAVVVRPGLVYGDGDEGLLGRAMAVAAKLKVVPVVGGLRARAQLIHVEDLADALLRIAMGQGGRGPIELADPDVRSLGDVIRDGTAARYGVTPRVISLPLNLVRQALRVARRAGLPAPIDPENLDGIEHFRPMDTRSHMAALGVAVRPFPDPAPPPAAGSTPVVRPRRLILIGAGRIGLVHALTAEHHQQMVLVGMVDRDRGAASRINAVLSAPVPMFQGLDQALAELQPDAAIVATPPSSHLALTKQLVTAGVDVLVEKPLAAQEVERTAFAKLGAAPDGPQVSSGYMSVLLGHLDAVREGLASRRFGTPTSFSARAFVTRLVDEKAERKELWELDPSISGGGALINLGVHVLAMLGTILGPVEAMGGTLVVRPGRAIEDAAWIELRAAGVRGELVTAWHLPGFNMPENEVRIETDRGVVLVTLAVAAFIAKDGSRQIVHAIDRSEGFDLAPMDGGGAFWREQNYLATRQVRENSLETGLGCERLIDCAYAIAKKVERSAPEAPPAVAGVVGTGPQEGVLVDLRSADQIVRQAALDAGLNGGGAVLGCPTTDVDQALLRSRQSVVSLPNAPGIFRTLTNEGPIALVRQLGALDLLSATLRTHPLGVASSSRRIWEVLGVFLRAELEKLDSSFSGTVVVDSYFVDLATATDANHALLRALKDVGRHCPRARIGLEANSVSRLIPRLPSIAGRIDAVMTLGSPGARPLDVLQSVLARGGPDCEVIVKTGMLPQELLELAWQEPDSWRPGRGRLAVEWAGVDVLAPIRRQRLAYATYASGAPSRPDPDGV